jgi:hypothetical protein
MPVPPKQADIKEMHATENRMRFMKCSFPSRVKDILEDSLHFFLQPLVMAGMKLLIPIV